MRVIALLALAACTDGPQTPDGKTCAGTLDGMAVSFNADIATIATLDLAVAGPADVTVTLTAEDAPTVQPPTWAAQDGAVSLPIYGLRPDTAYTATVVAESGDSCALGEVAVETDSLPAFLPSPTLATPGDRWGTYTLLGWVDNEDYDNTGALVLDEGGAVVWYWIAPGGVAANVSWVADDSGDILVRSDDRDDPLGSRVYRVSMAGELLDETILPNAHHSLGQAPDIRYAYLRAVSEEIDGEAITGDEIVEVGLDGTERVAWNAFDCLPEVEQHQAWTVETALIPGRDWTHTNGLSYCAADDTWIISTYYLRELHKIRRDDCSSVWVVDGNQSTGRGYTLPDAADQFGPQHAAACTDDGVVLFDNRVNNPGEVSRGLALDLDADAMTATARWSVPNPDGGQTLLLGGAAPLPNGDTVFGWGGIGEVSVNDDAGAIGWRVVLDHITVGSVERRETLYGY